MKVLTQAARCAAKFTALVALVALPLLLAQAPAAVAQTQTPQHGQHQGQGDWRVCADEGEICRFTGEAMVRFGTPGRMAFRKAMNRVVCDTDSFGDPAPGQRKQCQVSVNWRQDVRYRGWRDADGADTNRWRYCAEEGDECAVSGPTRVRFGANGRYETRSASSPFACTASVFGEDPSPGQRKACEVEDTGAWVLCANEGEGCRVPGSATVRYGANNRFVQRPVRGGIACNNEVFGDPVPGTAKRCEYLPAAAAAQPAPGPTQAAANVYTWQACAREDGRCSFAGPGLVRYGGDGRYAYREANDGLACINLSFGIDPLPDKPKQCQLLRLSGH